MAESVRNLPGFYHCERLGCSLTPEACGQRHVRAKEGHLPAANYTCRTCPTGAEHARLYDVKESGRKRGFLLDIAKGRSAETKARRAAAKVKRQTYPEQVREANEILARVDQRHVQARKERRRREQAKRERTRVPGRTGPRVCRTKGCTERPRDGSGARYCATCRPPMKPGDKRGLWTLLHKTQDRSRGNADSGQCESYERWLCRCACGREKEVLAQSMRQKTSTGCHSCAAKACHARRKGAK